jgi:hypothetical protein
VEAEEKENRCDINRNGFSGESIRLRICHLRNLARPFIIAMIQMRLQGVAIYGKRVRMRAGGLMADGALLVALSGGRRRRGGWRRRW